MHKIDHFAIGATSLDAGVDALEPTLAFEYQMATNIR